MNITLKNYLALANKPRAFYQSQEVLNITLDEKYKDTKRYVLKLETHNVGAKPENTVLEVKDINSVAPHTMGAISDSVQGFLFDDKEFLAWKQEWIGMPEFVQDNLMPMRTLMVHFETEEDVQAFARLVRQKITKDTKYIWYPESEKFKANALRYKSDE